MRFSEINLANRILIAVAMFACLFARAQDKETCTQTTIYASVFETRGEPLNDLSKSRFRLKLNKRLFDPENVQYENKANRIVIVLDTSGSMGGVDRRKWEVARTAVASIIRIAPPNVPIALIAFSNKVRKTFDFDENRLTIMDWLAEVRGERKEDLFGRTMLFDSISAADKMLEPHREGDAIYAITDGGDSGSNLNSKKLENQLLRHRVRLFAFLLDEPFAPKEELEQQQNFLQIIVNTGGFTFGASSDQMLSSAGEPRYRLDMPARERIEAQTALLVAQIGGTYRLDIRPTQALPDESRVSLELVNDKGKRRKDVIVLFPRRLMRCPDGAIANN